MNIRARHKISHSFRNACFHAFIFGTVIAVCAISAFAQAPVRSKVSVIIPSNSVRSRSALIEGNVVYVSAGDAVSIAAKDGSVYSIRLEGIDAPEPGQEYAIKSKEYLAAMIEAMDVTVLLQDADSEAPYLARVYFEDSDINLRQLENGMAWYYAPTLSAGSSVDRATFEQAERAARTNRVGLWAESDPVEPWVHSNAVSAKSLGQAKVRPTVEEKRVISGRIVDSASVAPIPAPSAMSRKYVLGPRGGCYYLSPSNKKVYVKDKGHCMP